MGEVAVWAVAAEEEVWRCRKHPSRPPSAGGVCPYCLRDRLRLLCPDCAHLRPCACLPSSSSSSSFSSLSSGDLARSAGAGAGIGAVGRVGSLIDEEPAFGRSRSVGFHLLRSRSRAASGAGGGEDGGGARQRRNGRRGRGWGVLWPFLKAAPKKEEGMEERESPVVRLSRSRSIGVVSYSDSGGGGAVGKTKPWHWHFPSPIKSFRHRKSTGLVPERSPSFRG